MTEPSLDGGIPTSTDATDEPIAGNIAPHAVEEGAFPRLQERTQTQLGFINSLLVTLAVGLLAFAVNASSSGAELNRLGGRRWLLFLGFVALALSVLSGLRLAFNRLTSHRITTRVARLRQLRDRYRSEERPYELRRLGRQADFFETWAWGSLSKRPEKRSVRMAAKALTEVVLPETKLQTADTGQAVVAPDVPKIVRAATDLVEALRTWYERADDWTWVWLRWQIWLFIGGSTLLLVVPLSYYFFSHAAR